MLIKETKTRTIILNEEDIKEAIIMYTKARAENDIDKSSITLNPKEISATIILTEEIKSKQ